MGLAQAEVGAMGWFGQCLRCWQHHEVAMPEYAEHNQAPIQKALSRVSEERLSQMQSSSQGTQDDRRSDSIGRKSTLGHSNSQESVNGRRTNAETTAANRRKASLDLIKDQPNLGPSHVYQQNSGDDGDGEEDSHSQRSQVPPLPSSDDIFSRKRTRTTSSSEDPSPVPSCLFSEDPELLRGNRSSCTLESIAAMDLDSVGSGSCSLRLQDYLDAQSLSMGSNSSQEIRQTLAKLKRTIDAGPNK